MQDKSSIFFSVSTRIYWNHLLFNKHISPRLSQATTAGQIGETWLWLWNYNIHISVTRYRRCAKNKIQRDKTLPIRNSLSTFQSDDLCELEYEVPRQSCPISGTSTCNKRWCQWCRREADLEFRMEGVLKWVCQRKNILQSHSRISRDLLNLVEVKKKCC